MPKIRLSIDELRVETFATMRLGASYGTLHAFAEATHNDVDLRCRQTAAPTCNEVDLNCRQTAAPTCNEVDLNCRQTAAPTCNEVDLRCRQTVKDPTCDKHNLDCQ